MRARGVWEKQSCRSALVIRNSGNRFFPLPSDRFTLEDGGGSIGGGGRDGIRNASKNDLSGIPSAEGRRSRAVSGVSSRSIAVLFPPYIVVEGYACPLLSLTSLRTTVTRTRCRRYYFLLSLLWILPRLCRINTSERACTTSSLFFLSLGFLVIPFSNETGFPLISCT